jgi:LysM repeat protein
MIRLERFLREGNSMVEFQLPKLITRVRFPSLAPLLVLFFVPLLFTGCVSVDGTSTETPTPMPSPPAPAVISERPAVPRLELLKPQGAYHKVKKGETIWRIAKAYNVTIDSIIKANRIPNGAVIEENQLLLIPGALAAQEVKEPQEPSEDDSFIWPVKGKVVSYFGDWKSTYLNKGIGIEAAEGETIQAARGGRVVFSDYLNGYGETVIIHHPDDFYSIYSQNEENLVKVGQVVDRGNPIGKVGRKGKSSLLHFEIRKKSTPDNPLYYLP